MRNRVKKILLCVTVFCLLATVCSCSGKSAGFKLSVMVLDGEGFSVDGENPLKVPYGGTASFRILIDEGLELSDVLADGEQLTGYTFEEGVLTVKNITKPVTLRLNVADPSKRVMYEVFSTARRGGGVTPALGKVDAGSVVTFNASPNNGAVFYGWSEGQPLSKGGKLLSDAEQFSMTVNKDTVIYANYDDSKVPQIIRKDPELPKVERPGKRPGGAEHTMPRNELVDIVYVANGGSTTEGGELYVTDFCVDYHEMPNSLPETGMFVREGYVLTGYSLSSDGESGIIGMGHKFIADREEETVLYCMWEKETPASEFTYSLSEGEEQMVKIDKYNGSEKNVYIPKYIGGVPVRAIGENAFSWSSVSSVYIPSTVKLVEQNAFSNCKSLSELTFFDSILSMPDSCFAGTSIKTVNLNAASLPRYPDNDLSFAKKYERFAAHGDKPRLIIVAGSSKHFGFDSEYAYELCDNEYNIVNYGTNAQMNVVFFLEALSNLASSGDYILFCPEQYGPFCYTVNGNPEMTALTFQGCESCYNLMSYVDVSSYTGFFDCYTQYSTQRQRMGQKSYEARSFQIDEYGDCSISRKNYNSESYRNGANGTFYFKEGTVPQEFADNVNRILAIAQRRGIITYLSHPPYNINACDKECLNQAAYQSYNADIDKMFSATLIGNVEDYILEGKYFFNTDYHPMEEGALLHTEQIMSDFLAWEKD